MAKNTTTVEDYKKMSLLERILGSRTEAAKTAKLESSTKSAIAKRKVEEISALLARQNQITDDEAKVADLPYTSAEVSENGDVRWNLSSLEIAQKRAKVEIDKKVLQYAIEAFEQTFGTKFAEAANALGLM